MSAGLVLLLGALWAVVHAVEAEKEVRILCRGVTAGQQWSEVEALFGTGEYVERIPIGPSGSRSFVARSNANLGLSSCTVLFEGPQVQRRVHEARLRAEPLAAAIALGSLVLLVVLQVLLAAGLPLGRLAWGGRYERLPMRLRVGSGLSAGLLVLAAVAVSDRARLSSVLPHGLVQGLLPALAALFALSTLANLASSSRPERWTGGPLAFLLTCSLLALVLSGGVG